MDGMRFTRLALAGLAALGLVAQTPSPRFSATTGDVSLTASTTALTIQQPATNGKQVAFDVATVYCSVACNVTQAQNGAAATATAGTAVAALPGSASAAVATVWTASNVGAGTTIPPVLHIAGGSTVTIDISQLGMGNTGTATNYTISVSSITGTANITIYWRER